ncbi:tol-pal system YbgF family protein [Spirochaetota bacterium]
MSRDSGSNDYMRIKKYAQRNNHSKLQRASRIFLNRFPRSKYAPRVKFILAQNQRDPFSAIKKFKSLIKRYKFFLGKDKAQYKICQIYELLFNWKNLKIESYRGMRNYPKSPLHRSFRYLFILSNIKLQNYDNAGKQCKSIMKNDRESSNALEALYLLTHISKKTYGFSRNYIYNLRELAAKTGDNELYPSVLYLLGEFYQKQNDHNRAFSAFNDILKKFPKSPEALYAQKQLDTLKKHKPKSTEYIPDKKTIKRTDIIDINPEIHYDSRIKDGEPYYSIAIGNFSTRKGALKFKRLLSEYGIVKTVKYRRSYLLLLGKFPNSNIALQKKIRIAEEQGINGKLVRIYGNRIKTYMFGE